MGKVITYMVAMGGKTAVWTVAEPRPEHVAAVAWLTDSSDARFYLVKVEAVRIGNSPAAEATALTRGFRRTYESILCVNFERNVSAFVADANLSIDALVKTAQAAYRKKSTTGFTNAVSFITMYLFWYLCPRTRRIC